MDPSYQSKEQVTVAMAAKTYHKLLVWAETLEDGFKRDEFSPDHVLNLQ